MGFVIAMDALKPAGLNPLSVSEETERKKKLQDEEARNQALWESTVKKEAQSLKWDEYRLTDIETGLRTKLRFYYRHLFPFEDMCTWLCYRNFDSLHCREFAYIMLPNRFRRYKTFDYFREMKFEFYKVCPVKIDIGAIFNMRPSMNMKKKNNAYPKERELIFDIDLSDYNTIRSCCKAEKICQKCWEFIVVAVKIMQTSFVEDFGWKRILWVFSGRRGVHCWVCDPDARRLSVKQRKQILKYYELKKPCSICIKDAKDDDEYVKTDDEDVQSDNEDVKGDDKNKDDDGFEYEPPDQFARKHVSRSYMFAKQYFVKICLNEQDILRTSEGVKQFVSLLPTWTCREKVTTLFAECTTSLEKWSKFEEYWKSKEKYPTKLRELLPHLLEHIVLWYLYPRIDVAVSTGMNHLLKAPFSFHPATLLLSAPFDPYKVDEFDVLKVPSLEKLFEFAQFEKPASEVTSTDEIQRQSYAESRLIFSNFLKALEAN